MAGGFLFPTNWHAIYLSELQRTRWSSRESLLSGSLTQFHGGSLSWLTAHCRVKCAVPVAISITTPKMIWWLQMVKRPLMCLRWSPPGALETFPSGEYMKFSFNTRAFAVLSTWLPLWCLINSTAQQHRRLVFPLRYNFASSKTLSPEPWGALYDANSKPNLTSEIIEYRSAGDGTALWPFNRLFS